MTFLDIFAGIGGFRLGMESAGHKCLGYIEIDKFAVKSYRAMYETEGEYYADDITGVRAGDLPKADVWCFGFPCQDISAAGKQSGLRGRRSGLFFTVTGLIGNLPEEDRPQYLIIENVKNLLSINGGFDFARVLIELDEIGYDAEWQLINTAWYLPQNRERVYIVGHLRGRSTRKVLPAEGKNCGAVKQLAGGKQGCRLYDPSGISCTLTSGMSGVSNGTGLYFIDLCKRKSAVTEKARCIQARYHKGMSNMPAANSGVLEVRQIGNACPYSVMLSDGRYVAIRRLTPLECFRLQGFPDELFYKAQAVNSDTQLYRQAGNSVSVPVVYDIATRLEMEGAEPW